MVSEFCRRPTEFLQVKATVRFLGPWLGSQSCGLPVWLGLRAAATAKTASTSITGRTAGTAPITRPVPGAGAGWSRSVSTRTGSGSARRSAARPGQRSRTSSSRCTPSLTRASGLLRLTRLKGPLPTGWPRGFRANREDGRGEQGLAAAAAGGHRGDSAAGPDRAGHADRAEEDGGDARDPDSAESPQLPDTGATARRGTGSGPAECLGAGGHSRRARGEVMDQIFRSKQRRGSTATAAG